MIDIDITKTWLYQEGKQKGLEEGIQKGIQKGRKEGIKEGIKKGLKEGLLSAVEVKFGKTPSSIRKVIMHTDDIDKLREERAIESKKL